jgi:hypothetical protein
MARLQDLETRAEVYLASRYIVGRSRVSALRIQSDNISGVHAEFIWDNDSWRLRDLGSRNGTFVDGSKLEPGVLVELAPEAVIGFGGPDNSYQVLDLEAPRLMAVAENGHVSFATDEIISLPDPENCAITIFQDQGGHWMCESEAGARSISDLDELVLDGRRWRILLPGPLDRTRERIGEPKLADVRLEFAVSRDQEHVDVALVHPGGVTQLESRAHAFFLLELAHTRLADAAQDHLAESEHGWRYCEDLMQQFDVNLRLLNLWVFRARKQLAQVGVIGASGLIERRADAQQLRLGIGRLQIDTA